MVNEIDLEAVYSIQWNNQDREVLISLMDRATGYDVPAGFLIMYLEKPALLEHASQMIAETWFKANAKEVRKKVKPNYGSWAAYSDFDNVVRVAGEPIGFVQQVVVPQPAERLDIFPADNNDFVIGN